MLDSHRDAFFAAADACSCWIGVREPNELADGWIGNEGMIPKGVNCFAKTADNPQHPFAGLVMDPTLPYPADDHPFLPETMPRAFDKWKKFAPGNVLPDGFSRDVSGPQMGLIRYQNAAIFADYDLMTLIPCDNEGHFYETTRESTALVIHQLYLNVRNHMQVTLGLPFSMIQHGPEFLYSGVAGAHLEDVIWFGPGRRTRQYPSSVDKDVMH